MIQVIFLRNWQGPDTQPTTKQTSIDWRIEKNLHQCITTLIKAISTNPVVKIYALERCCY